MKKLIALLCAFALFWAQPALAQDGLLLDHAQMQIRLVSWSAAQGQVTLKLRCTNEGGEDMGYLLFAPSVNGEPASFQYSWPAERISAPASSETETEITLYSDDPSLQPEYTAFRLIDRSCVSSEVTLDLMQSEPIISQACFGASAEEELLGSCSVSEGAKMLTFRDAISPEQAQKLDHAQLQICLCTANDGQKQLLPFATVRAQADPDGSVSAFWSGNAVVCSLSPLFPLMTQEQREGGHTLYHVSELSLSGLYVFYAPLELTLQEEPEPHSARLIRSELDFLETGPLCGSLPLALFDTLQLSRPVYSAATLDESGVALQTHPLTEPVAFSIVPAGMLGEIVAYFEYFFTDQTDLIHPIFPIGGQ